MTKEELIINKAKFSTKQQYNAILKAMDEYAQQQVIEFDKWRRKSGWLEDGSGEYYYQPHESTPFIEIATLYQLFIQSKQG